MRVTSIGMCHGDLLLRYLLLIRVSSRSHATREPGSTGTSETLETRRVRVPGRKEGSIFVVDGWLKESMETGARNPHPGVVPSGLGVHPSEVLHPPDMARYDLHALGAEELAEVHDAPLVLGCHPGV